MLKEAIDNSLRVALTLLLVSILPSCQDSGKKEAQSLYASAQSAVETNNFSDALALLDSLDSGYPAQVDIRRTAMHLRAKAIEGVTLQQLQETDSLIAVAAAASESMKEVVEFVQNPIEGYYISRLQKNSAPETKEGLYPRISPDGIFYLISSAKPGTLSTGVELTCGAEKATSAVVNPDGERNDRSGKSELITFTQAECDTLGRFALSHPAVPVQLTFLGGKGRRVEMSSDQLTALRDVYAAASVYRNLRLLQLKKNKLEQQLLISRSQQARTFSE